MSTHELKTWPSYFTPVAAGEKTFEIRFDDRGYQRGDVLVLKEWDPAIHCTCRDTSREHLTVCARYTGREFTARVGHVTASTPGRGNQRGFNGNGYVVLALVPVKPELPRAVSDALARRPHPRPPDQ